MQGPKLGHAPTMLQALQQVPLRTEIAGRIARSRGIRVVDLNIHVTRLFEDEVRIMASTLIEKYKEPGEFKTALLELAKDPERTAIRTRPKLGTVRDLSAVYEDEEYEILEERG